MKRQRKPHVQEKGGHLYFRLTWTEGGKRRERYIRLPDDEHSPEFDRAYWAVKSGRHEALQAKKTHTWRDLITAYKSHPKFKRLSVRTRKSYAEILDLIIAASAENAVADTTRAHVRAIHAKYASTPRKADWMIQVLSILFNFARKTLDWPIENPAEGIELYGPQREFEPWPEWMIAKVDAAPETVRTIVELILGTGQRPGAASKMRRDQIKGEWMVVVDEKADQEIEVYCPAQLRAYAASLPVRGAHFLALNLTQPLGYDAVEKRFRRWRETLGERARKYSLHGLRKLAIIRLAEAGCTDAQIQAITNQSAEMVAYYRRRASRKKLSRAGVKMLEGGDN